MYPQISRELEESRFLHPLPSTRDLSFAPIELMMGMVCAPGPGRAVSCQLIAGEGWGGLTTSQQHSSPASPTTLSA